MADRTRPSLTVLTGPAAGREYVIEDAVANVLVGSDESCTLTLPVEGVSPIHARIWVDTSGVTVFDTKSPSGVYVNDDRVEDSAPLRNGDILWLGSPGLDESVMLQVRVPRPAAPAVPPPEEPDVLTPDTDFDVTPEVEPTVALSRGADGDFIVDESEPAVEVEPEPEATVALPPRGEPAHPSATYFDEVEAVVPEVSVTDGAVIESSDADETVMQPRTIWPPPVRDEDYFEYGATRPDVPKPEPVATPAAPPADTSEFEEDIDETVVDYRSPAVPPFAPAPPVPAEARADAPRAPVAPPPRASAAAPAPPLPAPITPMPRPAASTPVARPAVARPTARPGAAPPRPAAAAAPRAKKGGGSSAALVVGGLATVLLLGGAAWWWTTQRSAPPDTPPATLAPATTLVADVPAATLAPGGAPLPDVVDAPPTSILVPVEEEITVVTQPTPSPRTPSPSPSPRVAANVPPVRRGGQVPPGTTPAATVAANPAAQVPSLLQQAGAVSSSGNYDGAIAIYDQVLTLDPGNSAAAAARRAATVTRDSLRKSFVSTRTVVQGEKTRGGPAGFDDADVNLQKAPDFQGRIEYVMEPPRVKPGDAFKLQIYLVNEGKKDIKIQGLTVSRTVDGNKSGGPASPVTNEVKPQQRALIEEQSGTWPEASSWRTEVQIDAGRGNRLRNTLNWR